MPDGFLVAKGFIDERTERHLRPGHVPRPRHRTVLRRRRAERRRSTPTRSTRRRAPTPASPRSPAASPASWISSSSPRRATSGRSATTPATAAPRRSTSRRPARTQGSSPSRTSTSARAAMPNLDNEGFAITPQAECVGGRKPVFWADDSNTARQRLPGRHPQLHRPRRPTGDRLRPAEPPRPSAVRSGPADVATASSGLPVALAAAGPCSVTGTAAAPRLTATGAGTSVVTASQAGTAFFHPATPVVRDGRDHEGADEPDADAGVGPRGAVLVPDHVRARS